MLVTVVEVSKEVWLKVQVEALEGLDLVVVKETP